MGNVMYAGGNDLVKKEKHAMVCGIIANVIYMIGDWLMNAFGTESTEIGLAAETGFGNIAMWRLTASIALGGVAICLMVPAAKAFLRLSEKTYRKDNKTSCFMAKLFMIGLYAALIGGFCIHTLCTMIGVIYKSALAAGTSETVAAQITNMSVESFIVPFYAFYLVLELATGISYIYKVMTKELKLKKAAVLCCSLVTLLLLWIGNAFNIQLLTDILTARESFGWVLMFTMGYLAVDRCKDTE